MTIIVKKILSLTLIVFSILSCNTKKESQITDIAVEINETKSDSLDIVEESDNNGRYWSNAETNLPIGVIITKDCVHGSQNENDIKDIKDNYVTIKQPNGFLVIIRDIDEDLFLNLINGDEIK